jgi:hypothetical protein
MDLETLRFFYLNLMNLVTLPASIELVIGYMKSAPQR